MNEENEKIKRAIRFIVDKAYCPMRYRFRFNEQKAEELIFTYTDGFKWVELPEEKRQVLLKKIEPDGEDYKLVLEEEEI